MAVKKSELYSMLWEACNKLRGGVEPARYKDYVLVLLELKYPQYQSHQYGKPNSIFLNLQMNKQPLSVLYRILIL